MNNIINVHGLKRYYGKKNITKAIDDVSFSVKNGEFLSIMGPSGSGKSTLLNLLASLDNPSFGKVFINETDIFQMNSRDLSNFRRQHMGFIFQDLNLLDTLTLYENIELVLEINKSKTPEHMEEILKYARILNIDNVIASYPYNVSGGQRQRCACIRAIIHHPDVIFADEPTGALDSVARKQFMELLVEISKSTLTTVVMVTHDINVASYSDRMLFLKDGRIQHEVINDGNKEQFLLNLSTISSE